MTKKHKANAIPTFEEAARNVHWMHLPNWRNAKHGRDFSNSLGMYAFPRIGGLKAAKVNSAGVLSVLQPIWLEKPETGRHVRQRIGAVMKSAIARCWRQDTSAASIAVALPTHAWPW